MARKDFHHPFQPYDIQQQFMEAVYNCIEDGKVGIFESPTGTGKSLSLLCGSLTWLREHKRKRFDESLHNIEIDDDEPQWLAKHHQESRRKEALRLRDDFERRLAEIRRKEDAIRKDDVRKTKKQKTAALSEDLDDDDERFLVDDYDSDSEGHQNLRNGDQYSAETTNMLKRLGLLQEVEAERSEEDGVEEVKIFFCSRTHSQLAQTVGELRRLHLPASLPPDDDTESTTDHEHIKQVSLGSRKNLCINPDVKKLNSQTAINERCQELQQASSKHRCAFLPKEDAAQLTLDFRDHALSQIRDIEDLAAVGEKLGICPYYASRAALPSAEIVTLPYPLLLQRSAREAMGISLRGHVVIIDEAHNLLDAVESTHSNQITSDQLQQARELLIAYLQKFRNKLKGSNRTYLAQIVRIVDSLQQCAKPLEDTSGELRSELLLQGKGLDQINLAKVARYISESKIARRVESYAVARKKRESNGSRSDGAEVLPETPVLTILQNFILTLINPSAEGRFFRSKEDGRVTLRYLLLDPSYHFRELVEESRAVILAGGTMSPMDDLITQLFPYLDDVRTLSCGHIVPSSSLFVRSVPGDGAGPFEFNYKTRQDRDLIQRLGSLLGKIVGATQGGVVIFFSSYAYLELVKIEWTKNKTLAQLEALRTVYFDSRTVSAEQTFQRYKESIQEPGSKAAVLFSVIGGKLSEGINFSDELGRCVIVVGMPFPNLETPEWKAKLKYIESKRPERHQNGTSLSRDFAENVCMRAVNQAVGRAIRHKQDWASIILLDARYGQAKIQSKLSAWIRSSLAPAPARTQPGYDVGDLCTNLTTFFADYA